MSVSAIQAAKEAKVPALFLAANSDALAPPNTHTRFLARVYGASSTVLDFDGEHNSPRPKHVYDAVLGFFLSRLDADDATNWNHVVRISVDGSSPFRGGGASAQDDDDDDDTLWVAASVAPPVVPNNTNQEKPTKKKKSSSSSSSKQKRTTNKKNTTTDPSWAPLPDH